MTLWIDMSKTPQPYGYWQALVPGRPGNVGIYPIWDVVDLCRMYGYAGA